ncbi:MAG: DegT/DnrJ/EryC1/StrS family aminotransferase [Gemmatimonadetes bacterium]|nr:DegT/DnrJ/EryC1/StrS family aminotransferase [Gemmatimonadota bacterium]
MDDVSRRGFIETAGASAAMAAFASLSPATASAATPATHGQRSTLANGAVHLSGDGLALTPREYATLLQDLTATRDVAEDTYLLGGEVEAFEQRWARLLGKETAVFMPSGTLANQLAVRALAGNKRRVIVPDMSHMYNDTGDACQTLSGLTLLPLAPLKATYTRADVEAVVKRTASGRVATDVGALVIESPIRRLSGEMFDWDEAQRVTAFAREHGIGTHLDGARLFIASAYTGIAPAEYAKHFDTVYVSLWKYFNCGIGAVLAGPRRVLDGMFHVRRMFGGNLAVGWPAARVAGHFMEGFEGRLKSAVQVSENFYKEIARHPRVRVERIPNGTNLTRLHITGGDLEVAATRLAQRGILLPRGTPDGTLTLGVNESWNRTTGTLLAAAFTQALA